MFLLFIHFISELMNCPFEFSCSSLNSFMTASSFFFFFTAYVARWFYFIFCFWLHGVFILAHALLLLWCMGSRVCGLSTCGIWSNWLRYHLSFPNRDPIHSPCIGRQISKDWTTGEVPMTIIFNFIFFRSNILWLKVWFLKICHFFCDKMLLWLFMVFDGTTIGTFEVSIILSSLGKLFPSPLDLMFQQVVN